MGGRMRPGTYLRILETAAFKTIIFALTFQFFWLFFGISYHLYSEETGFKYFKNYSYKEYNHQAQNWGMAQAKNGILYVANQGGVLEFDGVSWRVIRIPNYDAVRSIAIDNYGTIFIGGNNKIGYLSPDANGTLKYESLLDLLNNNVKNFSYVWRTHAAKEGVYFRTSKFLFRWNAGEIKVWKTDTLFRASYACKGNFYVQQQKEGLMQMVNGSLKLIPGGETFAEEKIWMMVPYDNDNNSQKLLIGTRSKGFFLYDGKTAEPFPTEVKDYLEKNLLYHGIRLSSGDFALATSLGGIVIMDCRGGLKWIFDKNSGLQDDDVQYVFQDNQGNIWLCLDNGISKIEYVSPISIYDERSNLPGIVLSVVRHDKDLYVGTTKGLYYLESPLKFNLIPGMSGSCWSLLSIGGSILAATTDGVFQVGARNNIKQRVVKDLSYILLPSKRYPGLTWCGTDKGLITLSQNKGRWMEETRFKSIDHDIRYIAEDPKGSLWLVTSTGSVLKLDFPVDINNPVFTGYETSHGLPGGRVYATEAAGHVMFATGKGIFRFDEEKKVFIPDRTLGNEFAGGPDSRDVFRIAADKNKNIWFNSKSRNFQAIPGPGGTFTIRSQPFCRIPLIQVNDIYPDPDGKTTWFASFDGLIRYDATVKKNYRQPYRALIRRVLINEKQENERQIFGGRVIKNKTGKADKPLFPGIEYRDRNLYFEFAAPFFEVETETRYRCFLEGYDSDWSVWSKVTKKNYTNLDPGLYSFRVRARNIYNHPGEEDIFKFKILPPWYRTWWAFLIYGIIFLLSMFLVVKWRSHRLEQEKQKLEHTIKERTKEIQEKNKQLKDQSEKLKEMDSVKSRFFANISHEFRTPLTLIMGPMEQMLSDSQDKKEQKRLSMMLRNSQRLLTLINQLLDLSRFDSGKVKLQTAPRDIVPFLKDIVSSFQLTAQKNRLELEFYSEKESLTLYFDAPKMEDVMYNLIMNALKFTPAGGKIAVSFTVKKDAFGDSPRARGRLPLDPHYASQSTPILSPTPGFVNISVRDTGIGIPKEQLAHIFDRFFQTQGPGSKQEALKGMGIGLALVKENVALHHGKIDVHSQEGKGTEFVIRLPLGHEHLDPGEIIDTAAVPPQASKYKEIESLYMLDGSEAEEQDSKEPGVVDTLDREKPVILVVEDYADVRKYICEPLQAEYTVIESADGKEGIEKAKEIIPDLIVSDIMMPGVDGYELCRELKKDIKTSHVPIILLTAKASAESIIQGLETGADDYITKPFNSKILAVRIKNLIELRRQLQQKIQKQMLLQPAEIEVSSMDQAFIKDMQEIIEKNLSESGFSVEELSKKLYMNRATVYRKIIALTGESPTEFIRSYRLQRAAQLLRDKFGTVSQVASAVGFDNPAYFAKCFKEKFHQLPSSYQAS
jgi:signal transduction histidine kinase/CheY-like chemotaxis protein/AraC-like DNA-binding protein/ligand-binding sensor domain-containing protein